MSFSPGDLYCFDEFELSRSRRTLLRNGRPVILLPRTFEVLACLVENPGRVLNKEEILKAVWHQAFVEENNLTQHISLLRKALADRGRCIATIPGRGYQLTSPVVTAPMVAENLAAIPATRNDSTAPALHAANGHAVRPEAAPGGNPPEAAPSAAPAEDPAFHPALKAALNAALEPGRKPQARVPAFLAGLLRRIAR